MATSCCILLFCLVYCGCCCCCCYFMRRDFELPPFPFLINCIFHFCTLDGCLHSGEHLTDFIKKLSRQFINWTFRKEKQNNKSSEEWGFFRGSIEEKTIPKIVPSINFSIEKLIFESLFYEKIRCGFCRYSEFCYDKIFYREKNSFTMN